MKFGYVFVIMSCFALVGSARAEQWLQRYHDAQHTSFISGTVDPLNRIMFDYIFDPSQVDVGTRDILIHYTDPKITEDGDIYTTFRDRIGNTTTYSVKKIRNARVAWNFISDYVRQPSTAWEPVFDFALGNGLVYVMGAFGCTWLLDPATGNVQDRICPYDLPKDPTGLAIWDVSPYTIDGNGNVFWTIRAGSNPLGVQSSIVKLTPDFTVTSATFADLTGDANQIAANNSAVAISADNSTIYSASTLANQTGGRLLALDQDFNVVWNASLRVDIPADQPMGPCHEARLNDSGTSSPIALPGGGAAIGGWNVPNSPGCSSAECPLSEGFYYSFNGSGQMTGCYQFGWDDTMGVITLNGTTYLVGKHNHYTAMPPFYEVVTLKADTLEKVGSFLEPEMPANEWCIDAPLLYKTIDSEGRDTGYFVVPSEGGELFHVQMLTDSPTVTRVRVGTHQNAAYVPTVSIGGPAYTINHGHLKGAGQ